MKIIDMHCDTISELLNRKREGKQVSLHHNHMHLDLKRMGAGGYLLQNFALFVNLKTCQDPWEEVCALHKMYWEQLRENEDMIAPVLTYSDIWKNAERGRMSALLTVEEGGVCKGQIEKLRCLYDMGVRMMTLTWNHPNELGYPHGSAHMNEGTFFYGVGHPNSVNNRCKGEWKGLTEKGREFVTEMERLGMIVDVSHLSDEGFWDVAEMTTKPFVASHSNARCVCEHGRNLSDDMIRLLADRGGCMGLNFYADFLKAVPRGEPNPGALEDVVRHALHITNVGGVEVLGLGSDFDGIDTNEALPGVQSMGKLWDALYKAGFKETELDKIFYGNVLRVYRQVLS